MLARQTLCNRDCPDACAIVVERDAHGRATRLRGDPDHPITRGFLCHRTSHFLARQYAPSRLTTPLRRDGGGDLVPCGWDEALDELARRLIGIRDASGPAAIFHYRSGGSLGLVKHVTDLFWDRFGPVTVKRGDICSGAGDEAQLQDFGDEDASDLDDLVNARQIVLWGKNPAVSSPHLLPLLRAARGRGTGLVLIDPVAHKTRSHVDRWIQPRPGGDFALAMATARLLFDRGWVDAQGLAACDGVDGFAAMARARSVADWCAEADVDSEVADDLAHRFGPGKPTTVLIGWGMARRENGGAIVRAIDALCAISGNLGVPGAGASYYFKRRGAFDTTFGGQLGTPPRTLCEPRFGPDILAATEPPVRAVWITAGNPVAMLPDSEATVRALRSRELVVVVDSFLTDTARLATFVLPTTTLLEEHDIVGSYGHNLLGVARPVVARPGDVRSDLEITAGLAARVGLGHEFPADPAAWQRRLLRPEVTAAGVTVDGLAEGGARKNPIAPRVVYQGRRFKTATGKVNLMQSAPGPASDDGSAVDFPLVLMALSTERSQSSQWATVHPGDSDSETTPGGEAPSVTVHPLAASAAGLADGAPARLESRTGALAVRVVVDPAQRRDVALMAKGGHYFAGRCANVLIGARTTDLGEGGALNDQRVRLVAL